MPNDKERLDWLRENAWGIYLLNNGWAIRLNRGGHAYGPEMPTQRRAIDAAMKAERTRKKEEGR